MSADLYLVALQDDPKVLEAYRKLRSAEGTIFDGDDLELDDNWLTDAQSRKLETECGVYEAPHCWIGQVSWLKALLMDDPNWLPGPVVAVVDELGHETPRRLTSTLATTLMVCLNTGDRSYYTRRQVHWEGRRARTYRSRGLARRQDVKRWLRENEGAMVTAESW